VLLNKRRQDFDGFLVRSVLLLWRAGWATSRGRGWRIRCVAIAAFTTAAFHVSIWIVAAGIAARMIAPFRTRKVRATRLRSRALGIVAGRTISLGLRIGSAALATVSTTTITVPVAATLAVLTTAIAEVWTRATVTTTIWIHGSRSLESAFGATSTAFFTHAADGIAKFLHLTGQTLHLDAQIRATAGTAEATLFTFAKAGSGRSAVATMMMMTMALSAPTTFTALSATFTALATSKAIFPTVITRSTATLTGFFQELAGDHLHALRFFIETCGTQVLNRLSQVAQAFPGISCRAGTTAGITRTLTSGHGLMMAMFAPVRATTVPLGHGWTTFVLGCVTTV
jgi:hypothetical protein